MILTSAAKVLYAAPADLLPCPYNRALDRKKVNVIKAAIIESQCVKPFVVTEVSTDDGPRLMVTDGHHRLVAVNELTQSGELPATLKVPFVMAGDAGTKSADANLPAKVRQNALNGADRQTLKPILDKESYTEEVMSVIWPAMDAALFEPLLAILKESVRENSKASLMAALRTGRVTYKDGAFVGEFSSAISRYLRGLGGEWDQRVKGFILPQTRIPSDARQALSESIMRAQELERRIKQHVDSLKAEGLVSFDVSDKLSLILNDLESQFKKTTGDKLVVVHDLGDEAKRSLAERYTNNLDIYIQSYTDDAILRLRQLVTETATKGVRAEQLAKLIEAERGVTKRKARFLARQETSMMVSSFREERYGEAGVTQYVWDTSGDERVRPDHKILDGRVFRFDEPPVSDRATGARNNPGHDFNCRCVAKPVLPRRVK